MVVADGYEEVVGERADSFAGIDRHHLSCFQISCGNGAIFPQAGSCGKAELSGRTKVLVSDVLVTAVLGMFTMEGISHSLEASILANVKPTSLYERSSLPVRTHPSDK